MGRYFGRYAHDDRFRAIPTADYSTVYNSFIESKIIGYLFATIDSKRVNRPRTGDCIAERIRGTLLNHQQADVTLIAACQQGDPRAYRHVYELYKDRVYGLCRNMSGSDEDAADLTQDVFISAFKSIQSFRMESAFGTWIYRIAVNRCSKALRKFKPDQRSYEDMEAMDLAPPSRTPNPEAQLLRKESNERVEAAIARLPESLRTIFVLGTVEGMRYREIAEILDVTEDAVKMRMHRARKRVRDTLRPYIR